MFEDGNFLCSSCGRTLQPSEIDKNTRTGTCSFCGCLVTFTRKEVNSSKQVLHDLENAVRFFTESNYDSAKRYAEAVLSTSVDNAVGLFIIAYYNAFRAEIKNRTHLDRFFNEELPKIELDEEEVNNFKKVILHSLLHVADYEKTILAVVGRYQAPQPLAEFVDAFSPQLIIRRGTIDWFDAEMCDIYGQVAAYTNVPKTLYALYQAITKNPDSPEAGNTYYLKTKTARFYNDFVLGIEKIYQRIADPALKAKFIGAFAKLKEAINKKMN